ncbi:translation initiation factor IF-3 [Thermosulfuriphilus ammonigenes]|uniref:Translation initiation factor IF-3 n=1 Tax=Thermosulfuriphilus ammonigenes TaxID=1936021 RepID=A0A6G7PXK7_9BACT|nr:translation initiation factor IF-3 [Thermosulfuriphilus ammonigenes]MBA2849348.1 translation initiation factor IF-3 [Thermosulfuriphilus ammonigenes]QIJ72424.1 translation initiation factor IF-3 [Thermosulfuriphilus ammonigenes]
MAVETKRYRINQQIRAREVRLIGADGKQIGIVPLSEALEIAREQDLDLVEIAPQAQPPVCRIMDYGKFLYQQNKKAQEAKKKQTTVQVKEIKVRPKTDEHDLAVKIKHIRRFLEEKNKVKVRLWFRGREIVHIDRGRDVLNRIVEAVSDIGRVEQAPKMEGRQMIMILGPTKEQKG